MDELLQTLGQWIYFIGAAIAAGFGVLVEKIGEWFSGIPWHVMPTMTKVFKSIHISPQVIYVVLAYIVLINIIAFVLYGMDKNRAKKKKQRISEKTLMRVCWWGGSFGALVGIHFFHHKTKHKKFSVGVPVLFGFQLILASFLVGFLGFWLFM